MTPINGNKPILLVEDDKIDAMTVKRALKDISVSNELVVREKRVFRSLMPVCAS